MARICAKKKEVERIRKREAIAIAADRRRTSACGISTIVNHFM
jgi:hypothetical protein